jgi:hypothetical protein
MARKLRKPVPKILMDRPLPFPFWDDKALKRPHVLAAVMQLPGYPSMGVNEKANAYWRMRRRSNLYGRHITHRATDPETGRRVEYHATKGFRTYSS